MTALDAAGLRALQKPLKDGYRTDPESALTPSRAVARLQGDGITATIEGWAGDVTAGLHPATGGDGTVAFSADLLLQAVAACAGVTLRSVATVMGCTCGTPRSSSTAIGTRAARSVSTGRCRSA